MTSAPLLAVDRRLVLGVSITLALVLVEATSFNYVLPRLVDEFDGTDEQVALIRLVPDIGALLVVFLAGSLGARWGERRVMTWSVAVFLAGAAITVVAPGMEVATAGVLLMNVARSVLFVVGIGLIAAGVQGADARASAFALNGAVLPVAWLFGPLLAGALVDSLGWRAVGGLWVVSGLAALALVTRLLPDTGRGRESGELLTPALAGLFLTAVVQAISTAGQDGATAALVVDCGVAVVALVALVVALRRTTAPTLSLAALRDGGLVLLLVVVLVNQFYNLFFYMNMTFQLVFGLGALATAAVLVPTQLACIGASLAAAPVIRRLGLRRAGVVLLVALAGSLLLSALVRVDSPVWFAAAVMALYGGLNAAAGIPITNAVMDSAAPGQEGGTSALRSAASNVGSAISTALMTAIVFSAIGGSLLGQAREAGIDPVAAERAVAELRDNAEASQVVSRLGGPVTAADVERAQRVAYAEGLRVHGLVGAGVVLGVAGLFYVARRRQEAAAAAIPAIVADQSS